MSAKIGIILGSDSDLPEMKKCCDVLEKYDLTYEIVVSSAHRLPHNTAKWSGSAADRGLEVIIAAAGMAAHLPGVVAAHTHLPVIGVPLKSKNLDGVDALYSIVQMPPGVPVATVAIDGSRNAAYLAMQILGVKYPEIAEKVKMHKAQTATAALAKNDRLQEIGVAAYVEGMKKMIDRYTRPEIARIWTLENKFKTWLDIEVYACEAWSELGHIPKEDVDLIREKARFTVERILEIEEETRHDVVAFTRCVSESLGEEKKWVHYGLTSTDVVDMALSSLIVEAVDIILGDMEGLADVVALQARKYKHTVMMGRTHGVHAELTTLGLKFALWYAEIKRNIERLKFARENIAFGKMSGAVGTFANIPPFVEEYVCKKMGLSAAPISTQTLQRDRHAHLMTTLAIIGGSLEKFATEIRGLQKTETREVEEPFRKNQKGSSAMPHKRNPIRSESITGMARVLRGYSNAAIEDMALWHERDISHSSVERIIIPDATTLVNYMLNLLTSIVKDLHVYPENMRRNIALSQGLTSSQRVLLSLIDKGLSREEAYDLVQRNAMVSWGEQRPFQQILLADEELMTHFTVDELGLFFDDAYHMKHVDTIFSRVGL